MMMREPAQTALTQCASSILVTGKLDLVYRNDQYSGFVADESLKLRFALREKAGGASEVLRFDNRQALFETEAVLDSIRQHLQARHPHPNPLPPAGEGAKPRKSP